MKSTKSTIKDKNLNAEFAEFAEKEEEEEEEEEGKSSGGARMKKPGRADGLRRAFIVGVE